MADDDPRYEQACFRLVKEHLEIVLEKAGYLSLNPTWEFLEFQLNEIFRMGGFKAVRRAVKQWPDEPDGDLLAQWKILAWRVDRVHQVLAAREGGGLDGASESGDEDIGEIDRRTSAEAPEKAPNKDKPKNDRERGRQRPDEVIIINDDIL